MLKCVKCTGETEVVDSRQGKNGVRRRRECKDCRHRFTTWERASYTHMRRVDIPRDAILRLRQKGKVYREIADHFGVSTTTAWMIGEGLRDDV